MIPGEIMPASGEITLNEGSDAITLMVANTGDRPVQVGSHYHFAETNPALDFDRKAAHGCRLDIAAGTAVRFEPGQRRQVSVIAIGGARRVFGFNGKVMGPLTIMIGLLFGAVAGNEVLAQTTEECVSPQTQQLMNRCAARDYEKADATLNAAWGPARDYARSIGQGDALLAAQRAWLTYRDQACDVHVIAYQGGSIQPLLRAVCLTELTETRTKMLQDFRSN